MNTRSILLVLSSCKSCDFDILGRKKCSLLTQEKRPFLGYSSSSSREFSPSQKRNKIIARKIGSFLGAEAQQIEHDDEDEDDSLISGI